MTAVIEKPRRDRNTMQTPAVSFVVPCYKLAHLLPDCIRSTLVQTYADLEVLIMDDCSPDDTAAVARSFGDLRVMHVRNNPNLGHLRNYNKGISLARGKYVWLISADDYLRRRYVLQRYVDVLERHPWVGYAFCAGVGVRDGAETESWTTLSPGSGIASSPATPWLKKLLGSGRSRWTCPGPATGTSGACSRSTTTSRTSPSPWCATASTPRA